MARGTWNIGDFLSQISPEDLWDDVANILEDDPASVNALQFHPKGLRFQTTVYDESPYDDARLHYLARFVRDIFPSLVAPTTPSPITERLSHIEEKLKRVAEEVTNRQVWYFLLRSR